MNKYRRAYIKDNGRTQLRKMSNRRTPPQPIVLDDIAMVTGVREIGELCKIWSPIYCSWVWEATVKINGLVLKREVFEWSSGEAIRWARAKYCAIKDPQFSRSLRASIMASDFSLGDIASYCEVTENAVSKWIAGDTVPSIAALVRFCKMVYPDDWKAKYTKLSKMIEMEKV
jgi:hypothetical protein